MAYWHRMFAKKISSFRLGSQRGKNYFYIRSMPVQSFCIGLPATYSAIVTCRLLTYYLIGQSLVVSNATSTEDHPNYPPFTFFDFITENRLAIL